MAHGLEKTNGGLKFEEGSTGYHRVPAVVDDVAERIGELARWRSGCVSNGNQPACPHHRMPPATRHDGNGNQPACPTLPPSPPPRRDWGLMPHHHSTAHGTHHNPRRRGCRWREPWRSPGVFARCAPPTISPSRRAPPPCRGAGRGGPTPAKTLPSPLSA
jgi:hypothetical protein